MRILVVEDDRKVAGLLARGLREEQHAVDLCADGEEALDLGETGQYDAIVLDVMLPKLDGIAVCRELRRRGVPTPILMLTARDALDDKVKGLDGGADDYLTKPFSFQELLARLRALLRRGRGQSETVLRAADLELDPRRRSVSRAGRRIELSAKEYALLECLLARKGRILSATAISEHVWDMNFSAASNVVSVTINHLRNKIDSDFEPKLIRTVRGYGYTIDENP